jgi:hypothetical protein
MTGRIRLRGYALIFVGSLLCGLALAPGCRRQPNIPQPSSGDVQKLPFDRESRANGASPTQSLVPAATHLPEGTAVVVRLQKELSSASARAGDNFDGIIEEPVVVEGQTLVNRGAAVVGRVLDSRRSDAKERGYLRIALVSVQVRGKTILLDTSSVFSKGGARDGGTTREVVYSPERRLTFHLTQGVDLP